MHTRTLPGTLPGATATTTRPASHAVEVRDLTKAYDGRTVVQDVSFTVEPGEIFAILGPNGAGKTTTVESIAGLRTPDTGTVRVFGHDPRTDRAQVRHLLGVQLQESSFHDKLTVREIVETYRGLYPDPLDVGDLLERLGLGPSAGVRYAKLSGGQQQRVSIAVALVGRPRAVVLDELTTGLDPQSRRETWSLVQDLRASGVTVLLVTHFMEEAELLADRLALLDRGRIVALDTPRGLVDRAGLEQRLRFATTAALDEEWIRRLPEVSAIARDRGEYVVTGDAQMLFSVVSLLAAHDIVPGWLRVDQPTLDDAFLALTGRTLHVDTIPEVAR
jgi:ABC-2 type transport system ATP-binding protein